MPIKIEYKTDKRPKLRFADLVQGEVYADSDGDLILCFGGNTPDSSEKRILYLATCVGVYAAGTECDSGFVKVNAKLLVSDV